MNYDEHPDPDLQRIGLSSSGLIADTASHYIGEPILVVVEAVVSAINMTYDEKEEQYTRTYRARIESLTDQAEGPALSEILSRATDQRLGREALPFEARP